jgi:hypothetical protein
VDNGTDVSIAEIASTTVNDESTPTVDYFLDGMMSMTGASWSHATTSPLLSLAGTVNNTASTITRTTGSFVTDGWQIGDVLIAAGLDTAGDNGKPVVILSVAATTLTLYGSPFTLDADSNSGTDVVLWKVGGSPTTNTALD